MQFVIKRFKKIWVLKHFFSEMPFFSLLTFAVQQGSEISKSVSSKRGNMENSYLNYIAQ